MYLLVENEFSEEKPTQEANEYIPQVDQENQTDGTCSCYTLFYKNIVYKDAKAQNHWNTRII